jgi:hypothetical protein
MGLGLFGPSQGRDGDRVKRAAAVSAQKQGGRAKRIKAGWAVRARNRKRIGRKGKIILQLFDLLFK